MYRTQCVLALVVMVVGLAQSWDIAVTAGDRLEFYTNGTKVDTVFFPSQDLRVLAYDEVHNMLLYVNRQRDYDAICGYNISYVEYKCYIKRNGGYIQGLAFDPITEILFFTDIIERSINWMSFKPGSENNINGNLLIKRADVFPTHIAVDSCRGHIYWINDKLTTSTIERARFNGSQREVLMLHHNEPSMIFRIHSLAIAQQTQKIYWIAPANNSFAFLWEADLNGQNGKAIVPYPKNDEYMRRTIFQPNALTISKESLFMVSLCAFCAPKSVWKFPITEIQTDNPESFFDVHTEGFVGLAAKYKISEETQEIQDCKALTNLVPKTYMSDDSSKIARELYEHPFCDHDIAVNGESQCTPGCAGERCNVSVCWNYCLHGTCDEVRDGFPKCRCERGYSGERCEVDECHGYCLNNGTCSINENEQPVCQCTENYRYKGDRCEVDVSVKRYEACYGYCMNNGTCSLDEEEQPVCQCTEDYVGDRCRIPVCEKNGDCSLEDSRDTAVKNDTLSTSPTCKAERNLTLADLFTNWRKPVSRIIIVEI